MTVQLPFTEHFFFPYHIYLGSFIVEKYCGIGFMSSSSHIRRVEISGEPRSFRQTFDVYLLFS